MSHDWHGGTDDQEKAQKQADDKTNGCWPFVGMVVLCGAGVLSVIVRTLTEVFR